MLVYILLSLYKAIVRKGKDSSSFRYKHGLLEVRCNKSLDLKLTKLMIKSYRLSFEIAQVPDSEAAKFMKAVTDALIVEKLEPEGYGFKPTQFEKNIVASNNKLRNEVIEVV